MNVFNVEIIQTNISITASDRQDYFYYMPTVSEHTGDLATFHHSNYVFIHSVTNYYILILRFMLFIFYCEIVK